VQKFQFEKRYKDKEKFSHITKMGNTIIKVDYAVRKEIMRMLNVTYPTIRKALNGETDTELSKRIRQTAIAKGGIELKIVDK
jgi:hypothetical protein